MTIAFASSDCIRFEDVRKTYSKSKATLIAVDGISFAVPAGQIVGLLGPNGAGKTTLLRILGQLVAPDSGRVQVAGVDVTARRRPLRSLGIVLEGGHDIYERLTPIENIEYFGRLMGVDPRLCRQRGRDLLERFGLQSKASAQARHLSRGMRQALSLCVALVHDPGFLTLDEPTTGLDPGAITALAGLVAELREQGLGILIATHDLGFIQAVADRILIVGAGRILKEMALPANVPKAGLQEFRIQLARPPVWSSQPPHLSRCARLVTTAAGVEVVCAPTELARLLDALAPFGILRIEPMARGLIDEYLVVQAQSSAMGRVAA